MTIEDRTAYGRRSLRDFPGEPRAAVSRAVDVTEQTENQKPKICPAPYGTLTSSEDPRLRLGADRESGILQGPN
jgi:hypothetical protein